MLLSPRTPSASQIIWPSTWAFGGICKPSPAPDSFRTRFFRPREKFLSILTTSGHERDSPIRSARLIRWSIRAGYGLFYVRIPQIYNSAIATENGVTDAQVFLNTSDYYDHQVFPTYPNPLVSCPLTTTAPCNLPAGFTQGVTNDVSAFALTL